MSTIQRGKFLDEETYSAHVECVCCETEFMCHESDIRVYSTRRCRRRLAGCALCPECEVSNEWSVPQIVLARLSRKKDSYYCKIYCLTCSDFVYVPESHIENDENVELRGTCPECKEEVELSFFYFPLDVKNRLRRVERRSCDLCLIL
jgi:hypothetical protein